MNATGNIPWQPILKTRTYRTIIVPKMFKGHGRTQRAEKLSWIFSCYKTLQTTTTLSTLVKLWPITMLTMNKARTRPTNIAPDSWPTSRTCTSDKDLNSVHNILTFFTILWKLAKHFPDWAFDSAFHRWLSHHYYYRASRWRQCISHMGSEVPQSSNTLRVLLRQGKKVPPSHW